MIWRVSFMTGIEIVDIQYTFGSNEITNDILRKNIKDSNIDLDKVFEKTGVSKRFLASPTSSASCVV